MLHVSRLASTACSTTATRCSRVDLTGKRGGSRPPSCMTAMRRVPALRLLRRLHTVTVVHGEFLSQNPFRLARTDSHELELKKCRFLNNIPNTYPSAWWLDLAPATLEFWVRFPNERNQGKQAHPVLKYRVPHGSHTQASARRLS
jgi:hypothetical protein